MQGIKNVPLYCLICKVPPPSCNGHESNLWLFPPLICNVPPPILR